MALNVTRPSRFKSYHAHNTVDDTTQTLYTCPDHCTSYMSLIFVSNVGNNSSDFSVDWWHNDDSSYTHIIGGKNLTVGEFLQLSGSFIVLEPFDRIEVTTTNTGGAGIPDVDSIATVEEVFLPTQG